MKKISVIVPIYKTGKILNKTLTCIRNQSFIEFECLLVDDGSNHMETRLICEKFVSKDSRFKYFTKTNEGIEKTRLYGVLKSETSLLMFCDHDDYYEKNALELLYNNYLKSKADIIVANCYAQKFRSFLFPQNKNNFGIKKQYIADHNDFITNYYLNFFGIHSFSVSTGGKLYKKELFEKPFLLFNINILEDIVINIQLFERAKNIHFIENYIYTYVYGGISSVFDVNSAIDGYAKIYNFRKLFKKIQSSHQTTFN